MVLWGAPSCPGWKGGGRDAIPAAEPLEGQGETPHSRGSLRRRKVQARCVRVRGALRRASSPPGGSGRSYSRALPGGSPESGDARHRPRARPRLARAAAVEGTPAGGPRPWRRGVPRRQPSQRGLNFLLAHKLRAPRSPDRPRDLGAPLPCPSAGGEDPALRSALARLPPPRPNPGSQRGTGGTRAGARSGGGGGAGSSQAPASRSRAARSGQRGLFWCASRPGTALQPPGRPAPPGDGQAGRQWGGAPRRYLNGPPPSCTLPLPGGGASAARRFQVQRILAGTPGAATQKGNQIIGRENDLIRAQWKSCSFTIT